MPNGRELALLVWFGVFLLWTLTNSTLRAHLGKLLKILFGWKMLVHLGSLFIWIAAELWVGYQLRWWQFDLATDVSFWITTSAFVLFINLKKVSTETRYAARLAAEVFGITAIFQFVTNLFVLDFWAELIVLPIATFLTLMSVMSAGKSHYRALRKLVQGTLSVLGITLAIYSLVQLVAQWGVIDWLGVVRKFALPVWLTIALLPFLFVASLWTNYGMAFAGINWANGSRGKWMAKFVLLLTLRLRTREVAEFNWSRAAGLARAKNFSSARAIVIRFHQERREAKRQEVAERRHLKRYAGSAAANPDGQRMDRREFEQTIRALRMLAGCQDGWYANPGNRYRLDLVDVFDGDYTRFGLPLDSGIEVHVSHDGQAWYASRRTITGWCFAIGGNGPPSVEWEYDGPDLPRDYPGEGPEWGTEPSQPGVNPNWAPLQDVADVR